MRSRVVLPLLLLVTAGYTTVALAQSPGTFTATGKMTVPRSGHTATLLTNGKVLVAGGYSGSGVVASAELYDPSTGVYTPTGDMITARSGHSAALLPDGKVLITQGTYWPSSYAELYDPATGTFTVTGGTTMVSGIVTVLKNGKVLITGNTAQLYDPNTNSFAPTGSYVGPFYSGPFFWPDTATLLQDGRVLIVGNAAGDGNGYIEHEELYDPVTGTFKVTGKPHTFGFGSDIWSVHTATLLPNGKVLLAGGVSEDFGYFSIAELYDPSTDTFPATANMTMARAGHTATLLPDGAVLVAGGNNIGAELYNLATGTFSSTGNMTTARSGHSATLLPDGKVLVIGGGDSNNGRASAELYTPQLLVPAPALFSLSDDYSSMWNTSMALQSRSGRLVRAPITSSCDGPVPMMIRARPHRHMALRMTVAARSAAARPRSSFEACTSTESASTWNFESGGFNTRMPPEISDAALPIAGPPCARPGARETLPATAPPCHASLRKAHISFPISRMICRAPRHRATIAP